MLNTNISNDVLMRFMDKVTFFAADNCWEWAATKNRDGYGGFRFKGKMEKAHRIAFLFANGYLTQGKEICHACDNPSCVNPAHLWEGTRAENQRDAVIKKRNARTRLTHCPRGHAYAGKNLYTPPGTTWRQCIECSRESTRKWKRKTPRWMRS